MNDPLIQGDRIGVFYKAQSLAIAIYRIIAEKAIFFDHKLQLLVFCK
jgi:hypothetical protein